LRNNDGSGVLAGLTKLSSVIGAESYDGRVLPTEGKLYYRGINLMNLADGILNDKRHGYAEVAYLLLFGKLPSISELEEFENELSVRYNLPEGFTEANILLNPSQNVMNQAQRLILARYNSDSEPEKYFHIKFS
jgi:citrate synthase